MTNILAVECTHEVLSVALLCGGMVGERRGGGWQKTAESIVPLMDEVVVEGGDYSPRTGCCGCFFGARFVYRSSYRYVGGEGGGLCS